MVQKENKYSVPIGIRFNDLLDPLDKKAKKERSNRSRVVRRALRSYLEDKNFGECDTLVSELAKVKSSLARIGGNMNQIARYFNTHDALDSSQLNQAHEELKKELDKTILFLRKTRSELIEQSR